MKILERQLYSVCVLQCVVVCCSVLQCVVVCCSVLQCCIVYVRSTLGTELNRLVGNVRRCWSVLQRVAVCRSVVQCVSVRCTCPTANWVPSWLLRNIRHFVAHVIFGCLCSTAGISRKSAIQSVYTVNSIPSWLLRFFCHFCCSWHASAVPLIFLETQL